MRITSSGFALAAAFLPTLALSSSSSSSTPPPPSSPPPLQQPFTTPASYTPPIPSTSSYHPIALTQSIELSGETTRSISAWSLSTSDSTSTNEEEGWVFGLPGQEGHVEAWTTGKKTVQIEKLGVHGSLTYYRNLTPLPSTSPFTLSISHTTTHASTPLPKTAPQTTDQITLLYQPSLVGSLAFLDAFPEAKERINGVKVKVKVPTPRVLDIEKPEGDGWTLEYTKGGTNIVFTAIKPIAQLEGPQIAWIHYTSPQPLLTLTSLTRTLTLSHISSTLSTHLDFNLLNSGPHLSSPFSRLEHQRNLHSRRASSLSINGLALVLPPRIVRPYFYDIVGNVSTSRFRPSSSSSPPSNAVLPSSKKTLPKFSSLELTPRYPIMGGWNYTASIGWDAPLQDYVGGVVNQQQKGGSGSGRGRGYVFGGLVLERLEGAAVDQLEVRVVLPEGAVIKNVALPFPVDSLLTTSSSGGEDAGSSSAAAAPTVPVVLTYSYLDSVGRPTVVLTKSGLNDRHSQPFFIEYELTTAKEWTKVGAVSGVLMAFFVVAGVWKRLEWKI